VFLLWPIEPATTLQAEHVVDTVELPNEQPDYPSTALENESSERVLLPEASEDTNSSLPPPDEVVEATLVVPPIQQPVATSTRDPVLDMTGWKEAVSTVFWVGEDATEDNSFIHNSASAWDEDWKGTFGGVDDPDDRCGYVPCAFTPKQSPFYVALPYNDIDDNGDRKPDATRMPWYVRTTPAYTSQMDGHWVAVRHADRICYGQVRDVGPYHEDDVEYVFGIAAKPLNTTDMKAGIDLSPAMRDCLGVGGVSITAWTFVTEDEVPEGPWLMW